MILGCDSSNGKIVWLRLWGRNLRKFEFGILAASVLLLAGCGKGGAKCLEVTATTNSQLEEVAIDYLKSRTEWKIKGANVRKESCKADMWMTIISTPINNNYGYAIGRSIAVGINDPKKSPFPILVTAYSPGANGAVRDAIDVALEVHGLDKTATISRRD